MSTKENFNPFAAMKKLMKSLVLFAAAAMALTSCENEAMNEGIEANDTYTMTFVAGAPESRTSVDVDIVNKTTTFAWSEKEQVAFVQSRGSKANRVDSNKFEKSGKTATFGATFSAINDVTGNYNYIAVYPSSNYKSDDLAKDFENDKLRVEIPANQTLTANSFDPKADLMVSRPISAESNITTAQSLEFTRLAAIGRMNLKFPEDMEDGENIEKIVFTIGDANTMLVGRHTIKFSDGTINEASYHGTNSVTLTTPYGGEFPATKGGTPIFFTCLEGNYSGAYSVEVTTNLATYSTDANKSIAKENALSFKAGDVLGFNLTVGNRVEKDLSVDYSGKYFVVAKDASNNYWGMKYDTTSDYRVATNSNKQSYTTYEDFGFTQEYVWNITKVEGEDAYYIGNYDNSRYITTVTDANNAKVHATTKEKVKLVKDEEGGYFTIQSTSVSSRYLELNAASSRFAFYKQTQVGELYLVPVTGAIKSNLTMTFSESALNFEVGDAVATLPTLSFNPAGTYAVTYSVKNTEGNVASVAGNVVSISTAAAGTATVTATFEGNDNFYPATASYTVTVKEKQQGGVTADPETITFANLGLSDASDLTTINAKNATLKFAKGTNTNNAPKYYSNGTNARVYTGNTMVVSSDYNIIKIEITFSGTSYAKLSASPESYSLSGTTGTWTGSAKAVTFTATANSRITAIKITYGEGGGSSEGGDDSGSTEPETPQSVTEKLSCLFTDNTTSGWGTSYAAHSFNYTNATIKFATASKQSGTITTMPVTKGGNVDVIMNNNSNVITAVTFVCKQWSSKTQTMKLKYSTDGGTTFKDHTTSVTWNNFTLTCTSLPAGTNAVRAYGSNTSSQVGIESVTITYSK